MRSFSPLRLGLAVALTAAGCASPYHSDRGAVFGGLTGAGVGALVGSAVGAPGAGAVVGAGVGAVSGAAIGGSLDDIEARNRAMIEARLSRPLPQGGVHVEDVIAMTQASVDEVSIINHIRANGVARPLASADLIRMQQANVSSAVVQTMQSLPPGPAVSGPGPVAGNMGPPPPGVIVEQRIYPPHCHRPPPCWRRHRGPHFGWGVSVSSDGFP